MAAHNPMTIGGIDASKRGESTSLKAPNGNLAAMPFSLAHALEVIKEEYGVDCYYKPKTLFKFGQTINTLADNRVTVAEFQGGAASTVFNETFATGNTVDSIVSDSASDTEELVVEGHILTGGVLSFVVQTVTLTGTTPVSLGTALARCNRIYNDNGTSLVGNIYVYDSAASGGVTAGVPDTEAATKCMITAGEDQSEKGATSISGVDYFVITQVFASINKGSGSTVTADVRLESRVLGKVFRPKGEKITVASNGSPTVLTVIDPPIIVPANSDVRITVNASASDVKISGSIDGYLATTR